MWGRVDGFVSLKLGDGVKEQFGLAPVERLHVVVDSDERAHEGVVQRQSALVQSCSAFPRQDAVHAVEHFLRRPADHSHIRIEAGGTGLGA